MTIIGDIYTPAERARIQGAMSAVWGFAAVVGPAASAFLVETVHWSVVFWVNLPIGAVSLAMFALFLNERVERREHRIDYLGGALLIVGVGALMLALVQAADPRRRGDRGARRARRRRAGLAAGARAPGPRADAAAAGCGASACWRCATSAVSVASATYMAVSALLPTYVQGAMGYSAGVSGFVVGAASVSWMVASIVAGRLMVHTSYRLTVRDRRRHRWSPAARCC